MSKLIIEIELKTDSRLLLSVVDKMMKVQLNEAKKTNPVIGDIKTRIER